jgi:hypothetical protein
MFAMAKKKIADIGPAPDNDEVFEVGPGRGHNFVLLLRLRSWLCLAVVCFPSTAPSLSSLCLWQSRSFAAAYVVAAAPELASSLILPLRCVVSQEVV